jgi:hypothetical protein
LRQYPEVDSAAPVVTVDHLLTNETTPQLTGLVDYPAAPIQVIVDGSRYAAITNGEGTWTLGVVREEQGQPHLIHILQDAARFTVLAYPALL